MKTILGAVSIALVLAAGFPAQAATSNEFGAEVLVTQADEGTFQMAEGEGDFAISEGQAADIAQSTQPEAKVIKVKLLPTGVYAVTLKEGGNVTRVMVDANSGAIL